MRVGRFRELVRASSLTVENVVEYLTVELPKILREISNAFSALKFTDNFQCFKVEVTIPATSELAIRNQFRDGKIPTERLIVRGNSGSVVDGDTEWTRDFVYLKNTAASSATVTVIFLA